MKTKLSLILFVLLFVLAGCSDTSSTTPIVDTIDYSDTDEDYSSNQIDTILDDQVDTLTGNNFDLDDYFTVSGDEIYLPFDTNPITEPGTYFLEGTYTETIVINTPDEDVELILSNVTIQVEDGPAILVLDADDVTITSLQDTINTLSDSATHSLTSEGKDYGAVIYSNDDLVFNGTGTLIIDANYNNAIYSKDDIKLLETTLDITSVDDGIVARDYIALTDVVVQTDVDGDCLVTTYEEDNDKGFIYVESGVFSLSCGDDGFQAINDIVIYDGEFYISSLDNGLSSDTSIYIGGGTFDIEANTDAINASDTVTIYDGEFVINASDDGIHADFMLVIEGGDITVESSYEGLEAFEIYINGGLITVAATDDGINATAGGGQIHSPTYVSTGGYIEINGGIINVNASSDGVDVNGTIVMNDGYLIVFGSSEDNQSSIDYDDTFNMNGGVLVAVGSTGMIQSVSNSSTQASIIFADSETYSQGDLITLFDSDENVIIQLEAVKTFTGIVISTDSMTLNESYTLTIDSSSYEFTLSSLITSLGDGGNTNTVGPPPRR